MLIKSAYLSINLFNSSPKITFLTFMRYGSTPMDLQRSQDCEIIGETLGCSIGGRACMNRFHSEKMRPNRAV